MVPEIALGFSNQLNPRTALSTAHSKAHTDARTAAREYESVFVATMLNAMSSGIEAETPFGGGNAEATWRGMQNEEIAKEIAASGGLGIADAIYRELIAIQEGTSS